MSIEWIHKNIEYPDENLGQILVFSPNYDKNNYMRIRFVHAKFFSIFTEATMWAKVPDPEEL